MNTSIKITSLLMILLGSLGLMAHKDHDPLQKAVDAPHRADSSKRDGARHPYETLSFFQVEPHHSVVEISPGGKGWYTEILAPYLKAKGVFYAAQYNPKTDSAYRQRNLKAFSEKLAANPELYSKVKVTVFDPPEHLAIAPEASVDRILTFRNLHNWHNAGEDTMNKIFAHFYSSLKPGGMLGIIDHRLPESVDKDARGGYVKQSYVVELAKKAGFKLAGKSEINANAKDTADHPKGVWTLPPTLNMGEENRDKYQAIGESDRFTLLFVKPLAK
jgi:predicted methyltransferase